MLPMLSGGPFAGATVIAQIRKVLTADFVGRLGSGEPIGSGNEATISEELQQESQATTILVARARHTVATHNIIREPLGVAEHRDLQRKRREAWQPR